MPAKRRIVVGCVEPVDIPSLGLFGIDARVDTGALTSALHVENLEELPANRVRFDVRPAGAREKKLSHVLPVARRGRVRASTGVLTSRVFVVARVQLGPVLRRIEVGLVDRSHMEYRMLLGRTALAGYFVVDPALERTFARARARRSVSARARKRRPGSA